MSQLYLIVKVSLDSDILIAADVGPVFVVFSYFFFPTFYHLKKEKKEREKSILLRSLVSVLWDKKLKMTDLGFIFFPSLFPPKRLD